MIRCPYHARHALVPERRYLIYAAKRTSSTRFHQLELSLLYILQLFALALLRVFFFPSTKIVPENPPIAADHRPSAQTLINRVHGPLRPPVVLVQEHKAKAPNSFLILLP
jgi:hypothetical protein